MALSPDLSGAITPVYSKFFAGSDPNERKALVRNALWGAPFLENIDFTGAAGPFAKRLVADLSEQTHNGLHAHVAVLKQIRASVGSNWYAEIDGLVAQLTSSAGSTATVVPVSNSDAGHSVSKPCSHLEIDETEAVVNKPTNG